MASDFDLDSFPAWVRRAAALVPKAMEEGALLAAEHAAGELREVVLQEFDTRTGTLAASWRARLVAAEDVSVTAGAFSDVVYARIQDEGGTIFPRTVKRLAVPLKRSIPVGKWPRHFPKGALFLNQQHQTLHDAGTGEPMFALKRHVTIPGRNYIEKARERAEPEIAEIIADATTRVAFTTRVSR